jgi:hypothetical protein
MLAVEPSPIETVESDARFTCSDAAPVLPMRSPATRLIRAAAVGAAVRSTQTRSPPVNAARGDQVSAAYGTSSLAEARTGPSVAVATYGDGVVVGVGVGAGEGVGVGVGVDVAFGAMKFTWTEAGRDPQAGSVPIGVTVKSAEPCVADVHVTWVSPSDRVDAGSPLIAKV